MKKLLLKIICMFIPVAINAQTIKGDMDGNGKVDIKDVTEVINTVLGKSPIRNIDIVDNSLIAGVWYKSKDESIAFVADGTTNYEGASQFKFVPALNCIILCNSSGKAKGILNAKLVDSQTLIIDDDISYYRSIPKTLVKEILLNSNTTQLYVDGSIQLNATILPIGADNKEVVWTSDNENIAIVENGLVNAKAVGSTTITCKAADGSGVVATCTITVSGQGNPGGQVSEGSGA